MPGSPFLNYSAKAFASRLARLLWDLVVHRTDRARWTDPCDRVRRIAMGTGGRSCFALYVNASAALPSFETESSIPGRPSIVLTRLAACRAFPWPNFAAGRYFPTQAARPPYTDARSRVVASAPYAAAQSALNPATPESVSGCLTTRSSRSGAMVAACAPARATSCTC